MALRRVFAVVSALVMVTALSAPSYGQEPESKQQLTKEQLAQYDALNALVNNVVAGKQPAPADVKLTLNSYFLKSDTQIYIPYTLDIEPKKFTSPVGMYVRVVDKKPAAAPSAAVVVDPKGQPPAAPTYAFEDIYFLPANTDVANRALELPPGEYDLIIAMKETPKDRRAVAKSSVHRQALTVPEIGPGISTSSVILARGIEAASGALTGQQQLEQPYTIAGYKITPRFSNVIPKAEEFVFVFWVYNEGATASGKPDVDVDYLFYRAAEEKPFSKLATTSFNATTLPAEFSVAAGHQVFVGQGIPLSSFDPGDYKLEIKILDKTNSSTIIRSVPFTVTP